MCVTPSQFRREQYVLRAGRLYMRGLIYPAAMSARAFSFQGALAPVISIMVWIADVVIEIFHI